MSKRFHGLARGSFRPSAVEVACLLLGAPLILWYGWILDDAYIYFRYADNWVIHGLGLVYNEGEYVEAFSSPLWMLLLAGLRLAGINFWHGVLAFGLLCFGLFWLLACIVDRQLRVEGEEPGFGLDVPLVYLTFNYAVLCYFTSGVEAPLVLVMAGVTAAVILLPTSPALQIGLGLAPVVRHELILPFLLTAGWLRWRNGRLPLSALLTCAVSLGGYLVFRVGYYADLLPSTFYLKDEIWVSQGLKFVWDTLLPYYTVPYLLAAALAYRLLRGRYTARELLRNERLMMLAVSLPVVLYVVKIGGGARHFRYLAFPFCLAVFATGGLLEAGLGRFARAARPQAFALAAVFALFVATSYPRQLTEHPILGDRAARTHRDHMLIYDAAFHRMIGWTRPYWKRSSRNEGLPYASTAALSTSAARDRYDSAAKTDVVLVEGWCKAAYLQPRTRIVHQLGLTEPFLARMRMGSDRPSHKGGLIPLARDIERVRSRYGARPGAFEAALDAGLDLPWVRANRAAIADIERKIFGERRPLEDARLAFSSFPEIVLPEGPPGPEEVRARSEP